MAAILARSTLRTRYIFTLKIPHYWIRQRYFHSLEIDNILVRRLKESRIVKPTTIQTKAIKPVLEGRNTVINAETGSGKTLCYLLPIIHRLILDKNLASKPPYAIVLLPSIELCHQVASVFQSLTDHTMQACVVHRDSRLQVDPRYPIVLATPSALFTYGLCSLENVRVVVIDEADLLLSSGGDRIWEILSFFKGKQSLKERRRQKRLMKQASQKEESNKLVKDRFFAQKSPSASTSLTKDATEKPTDVKSKNLVKKAESDSIGEEKSRQFVFVAATLPSRGSKSAFQVLKRWLSDADFVTTELVHHTVPTVGIFHVKVHDVLKLPVLLRCLNSLIGVVKFPVYRISRKRSKNDGVDNGRCNGTEITDSGLQEENVQSNVIEKTSNLESEQTTSFEDEVSNTGSEFYLEAVSLKTLRVLVFTNTTKSAQRAFNFLTESTEFDDTETTCKYVTSGDVTVTTWQFDTDNFESQTLDNLVTRTGEKSFWLDKIGQIHKNISPAQRIETLQKFKSGDLKVLICTDLASRGLDIPDVSHVIQLDFAPNAAQVLHRTGRTARAGTSGQVINFITDDDEDLARALRACEEAANDDGYHATFSRNRMFRRRVKAKSLRLADNL